MIERIVSYLWNIYIIQIFMRSVAMVEIIIGLSFIYKQNK